MLCVALLSTATTAAAAQEAGRADLERLARAYPERIADRVERLLDRAEARSLPSRSLADKALEGAAKGVSGERLLAALERRLSRLRRASAALGAAADPASTRAGAMALSAGLSPDDLGRIGEVASGAERPAALVVLGELKRLGVPVDRGLAAVEAALSQGDGVPAVLALGARVRSAVRRGVSSREALGPAGGLGSSRMPPGGRVGLPAGVVGPPVPVGSGPPPNGPQERGRPGGGPPGSPPPGGG